MVASSASSKAGRLARGFHFQLAPGVLDRVEFGRVGRQKESRQVIDTFDELGCPLSSVGIEAIPNQQAGPPQFLVQMPEETDDLEGGDVDLGMQAKVEPHPESAGRHSPAEVEGRSKPPLVLAKR